MKAWGFYAGLGLILLGLSVGAVQAQPAVKQMDGPEENIDIQAITQYRLQATHEAVYGLFDLGGNASVRLPAQRFQNSQVTLILHGRHYATAETSPFSAVVAFEDVTGQVFQQSGPVLFNPVEQIETTPQWFEHLETVAGFYGEKSLNLLIPPGTVIVNIQGDTPHPVSPNQLVGYVTFPNLLKPVSDNP